MRQPLSSITRCFSTVGLSQALGGAIAAVAIAGLPALALQTIGFQDLTNLAVCVERPVSCNRQFIDPESTGLGEYDEIQYQVSDQSELAGDEIELGFRSILDWAKEVRVVDAQGRQIVALEAEDKDSRLRRTTLKAEYLEGAKLVFVKGRMFGVRRAMYEMPLTEENLAQLLGKRVTFTWVRD
ncbi:MAG: hypothetical protein HC824_02225 [Synechococcales cyanobacterium RM1_1_8]|nr:hypothetical protein [Synechococcales cyanobacterium RM1_1_8]